MNTTEQLITYIKEVVGFEIKIQALNTRLKGKLPLYLKDTYKWHEALFENKECLLAIIENANQLGINQIGKQFQKAKEITDLPVIAVFNHLEAYKRKRLIEKKIAFIVPGKQLYIPEFIIDLREYNRVIKKKKSVLSPMAQQLFLLFLLDKPNKLMIEKQSLKKLAELLETNPMGVTRAVESLKDQGFIEIMGDKEKTVRFIDRQKLWAKAKKQNSFINPVLKRIYIDELPPQIQRLHCNDNALAEYTDINPTRQAYYAIEKSVYYALKKTNTLINENSYEGQFCMEVWKYNPATIIGHLIKNPQVVDPLSLFLCYKNDKDERIEMALEQIEKEFLWYED